LFNSKSVNKEAVISLIGGNDYENI
jgi:hypothetical protein